MDTNIVHDVLRFNEEVYKGTADNNMEFDIIVPDYLPDVLKIVRVDALPVVRSSEVMKNRITVDGTVEFTVIYMPENSRALRTLTQSCGFEQSFDSAEIAEGASVFARASVDFVMCRLTNSRKMVMKAGVKVFVKAERDSEVPILVSRGDAPDGIKNVEALISRRRFGSLVGRTSRSFQVEEDLEIAQGKPSIAALLRADVVADAGEIKVINNKIIAKGLLRVTTLYVSDMESGGMELMEHEIPFSQIIELEGVSEECLTSVQFHVEAKSFGATEDENGESRLVNARITLQAVAAAYRTFECECVTDAYSPKYECEITTRPLTSSRVIDIVRAPGTVKETVELENEIAAVIDVSGGAVITGIEMEEKKIKAAGSLNVSIMTADADGVVSSVDKALPIEFEHEVADDFDRIGVDAAAALEGLNFSITSATGVMIRAQVGCELVIKAEERFDVISDIAVDEEKPKEGRGGGLTLYYPDAGESLWEIAKRYNTSMSGLRSLNNLDGDMAALNMLLIPSK